MQGVSVRARPGCQRCTGVAAYLSMVAMTARGWNAWAAPRAAVQGEERRPPYLTYVTVPAHSSRRGMTQPAGVDALRRASSGGPGPALLGHPPGKGGWCPSVDGDRRTADLIK